MENTTSQENTTTQTNQRCLELTLALYNDQGMALYAIVATIIITFVEKRRCKAEVCHGRPGLPLPINFLDGTTNSIANAAAFGCTLEHILYFILSGPRFNNISKWLIAPTFFLVCFLMSMVYYPIFACLNSSSRLVGSIIGFLYTLLLFLVVLAHNYLCNETNWEWALYAIALISEVYLLVLFIYRIVTALCKKSTNLKEPLVKIDQLMHVKYLLQKPKNSAEEMNMK
ncbi:stimulated by retinoic acid gene 6 protein-like [Saccostrea cucullata]|uniref:stimulated by retinoic acid gene 6 protein-like n=1 Tax=Saccostrea cuccullata TaxID=36930 RepID=UPI002ED08B23